MATILYLLDTAAQEPKPNVKQSPTSITQWVASTLGGGQDNGSAIYPLDMKASKGPATNSISQSITETGAAHYAWFKAWISAKLNGDQTIAGTLTVILDTNEGNAAHNMMPRIRVYVWKGDDSGVRGTLYADANSATESDATDGSKQTFFNAVSLTSVAALHGDRIVIEIMAYDNNTKTVAYAHRISFADSGTASDSYIQFSQDLVFQGEMVERSVGEPSISVSDATERIIRRDIPVSEPSMSVADSISYTLRRTVDLSEPSLSVSDQVSCVLRRIAEISETSISVSDGVQTEVITAMPQRSVTEDLGSVTDALELAVQRLVELSEEVISIADSLETVTLKARDVSELAITVSDEASYLLRRVVEISEPSITVGDSAEVAVHKLMEHSELAIAVSDSVLAAFVKIVSVSELIGGAPESPKLILTVDGHLVLRISKPTQEKPQYILIK